MLQKKVSHVHQGKIELTQWERFLIQHSEMFIEVNEALDKMKDLPLHMKYCLKMYET